MGETTESTYGELFADLTPAILKLVVVGIFPAVLVSYPVAWQLQEQYLPILLRPFGLYASAMQPYIAGGIHSIALVLVGYVWFSFLPEL